MDEKLIIDSLVQGIKNGNIKIDGIPEAWRIKVKEEIEKDGER